MIAQHVRQDLVDLLIRHEAIKLRPYKCSRGKITIGVGRNLEDTGITEEEALFLLSNDIARVESEARRNLKCFDTLGVNRQNVVLSMIFNLGIRGFMRFQRMISALERHDYDRAADEMLASTWSAQVGRRAVELAEIMRAGMFLREGA